MDEHIFQYSSDLQLPSSNLQGNYNYVPYVAEHTFSQDHDNYSLPQWLKFHNLDPSYADYLLGSEISNMQGEIPYGSTGIGCSFMPKESFLNVDAYQTEPNPYARLSMNQHDEVPVSNYKQTEHKVCYQQVPTEVVQHQPNMSASTSEIPTKSRNTRSKRNASEADRRRRTRIATALDALNRLLPHSNERDKANVVDDCVDYIRYLQLHMRELSQNGLRGEPTSNDLVRLEGHGTYVVNGNTASGPLQDMLRKLLHENPSEARNLLASRDLFMLPVVHN
ncbi:uncharacterized protein LOC143585623 [Bidens hawaiensis]|uniref:uncharacterized protein LOC143585623 n=1 Tax=Bidens hawaiensis TaxID=980011 RepID=UPI00404B1307